MRKVLYLMGVLEDTDMDWLASHGSLETVEAGTIIVDQGVSIDSLFVLLDGQLSIFNKANPKTALNNLYAGEVIGEISFVDSRPPIASVRAETRSQLVRVHKELLKAKINRDLGFAARFYHALALFLADRMRSTMGGLGYECGDETPEVRGELDDSLMDYVALGATRFDRFLRQMHPA